MYADKLEINHRVINDFYLLGSLINPRSMREGYGSRSVCVCVCLSVCLSVYLSVTAQTTTYLVCESKFLCCKVPYGVPN